jgi:hypothetical protein
LPPGLVQRLLAAIASIISFALSGSLLAAKSCAAASMAVSFFSFGSLAFLAVVTPSPRVAPGEM